MLAGNVNFQSNIFRGGVTYALRLNFVSRQVVDFLSAVSEPYSLALNYGSETATRNMSGQNVRCIKMLSTNHLYPNMTLQLVSKGSYHG